jgi:hypothetical protein
MAKVARFGTCYRCSGSGFIIKGETCSNCGGRGATSNPLRDCYVCNGTGKTESEQVQCPNCDAGQVVEYVEEGFNSARRYETKPDPVTVRKRNGDRITHCCHKCGGTGYYSSCWTCGGSGYWTDRYDKKHTCDTCGGEGAVRGSNAHVCSACGGDGHVLD